MKVKEGRVEIDGGKRKYDSLLLSVVPNFKLADWNSPTSSPSFLHGDTSIPPPVSRWWIGDTNFASIPTHSVLFLIHLRSEEGRV
jgi:hypothetical protein